MSLTIKKQGGDFEMAPEGTHAARCYQIIDIGVQRVEYKGEQKLQDKVILSFELPDEKMADGRPFIIHQEYTASLNEKAKLRAHLESWRGKAFSEEELMGFDIGALLNQPCLVSISHRVSGSGNNYTVIAGISKPLKGQEIPALTNPTLKWEMGGDETNLPEWIQKKVTASVGKPEMGYSQGDGKSQVGATTQNGNMTETSPTTMNSGGNELNPPVGGSTQVNGAAAGIDAMKQELAKAGMVDEASPPPIGDQDIPF